MNRRALLATVAGTVVAAGCLSDSPGSSETAADPQTTRAEPAGTTTETASPETARTATPRDRVGVGVRNESEGAHSLSVRVTDGAETLLDRTVDVRPGPGYGRLVAGDLVGAGTYRVVAELDAGARLDYEWRVTDELGHLDVVVTAGGGLEPRQRATPDVSDDLPYAAPGAESIFAPPGVDVRNESDEDATVTVTVAHDGDRVFAHTFDAATDRAISTDPVVATHGTYDVVAETGDGRRTAYEWAVPERWAWPTLAVLVADDGTLRVGCGWPRTASLPVENRDDADREVTVRLARDDGVVAEATRTVPPGTTTLDVDLPMGDRYEVTAETDAGSDTAPYAACDCWSTHGEVTVEGGAPTVETFQAFCE